MANNSAFELFQTITIALILVLGTIGNILVVLVVIRRRKMRTVTNYFILNLAIADLMVLLSNIPFEFISTYWTDKWIYGKFGCKIIPPLQTMGTSASVLTLVIISLSRYYAVVYPFRSQMKITHARGIIVGIWIISLASITPFSLAQKYDEKNSECNEDFDGTGMTPMMYTLTIFFLQYIFPMIGMTYAYNRIRAELNRQHYNEMGSLVDAEHKKESKKIVKMLCIVVAVFAIFVLPLHIYYVWQDCFNGRGNDSILGVAVIMLYCNSFINPIIYSVWNDNFRTAFKQVFGSCFKLKCSAEKFSTNVRGNSVRLNKDLTKISEHGENGAATPLSVINNNHELLTNHVSRITAV